MNALNVSETATNALASGNWELQDELNDADLMVICGGGGLIGDINVDASHALQNALQYAAYEGVNIGAGILGTGVGRTA